MAKQESSYRELEDLRVDYPSMYRVIMHNDDVTTFDFVVSVLTSVFFKSEDDAQALTMAIHERGSAVVGVYPLDIAQSKVAKVTAMAAAKSFPLKLTIRKD